MAGVLRARRWPCWTCAAPALARAPDPDRDRIASHAAAVAVLLVEDAETQTDRPYHAGVPVRAEAAHVEQATGTVLGQIGADVVAALHRLRAHVFTQDRLLNGIVDDVLASRLHFDPTPRS